MFNSFPPAGTCRTIRCGAVSYTHLDVYKRQFLEEKLALLGLTDKEAADFITFWAPQIRANEYTFVSFDASSYTAHARYSFTDEAGAPVEPDTFIRVFMTRCV